MQIIIPPQKEIGRHIKKGCQLSKALQIRFDFSAFILLVVSKGNANYIGRFLLSDIAENPCSAQSVIKHINSS